MIKTKKIFLKFLPFWLFLVLFKFGAGLQFTLLSPFGERLFPLWLVGILIGGSAFLQLLLDVPVGYLLDRFGYRRLLAFGTLFFMLSVSMFTFGLTPMTYLCSLFFATLGWLFFGPGISAYVLSQAPKTHSGRFISLRDTFESLGIVCSSAAFTFVLLLAPEKIGWTLFAILCLAFIAILVSPKDCEVPPREGKEEEIMSFRFAWFRGVARHMKALNPASTMLLLHGFVSSMFYAIIWFVVPLVIAHDVQAGILSLGLGIFDFSVVILGFFIGNLVDRVSKRSLVFFGLLLFGVAGALLGFNFGWLFLLFGFLATTGDEFAGISLWSWLHSLDQEHTHDGAVSGVINLAQDLGWAAGPVLAGVCYGVFGPSWTILIGSLPILFTWVFFLYFLRHGKRVVDKGSLLVPPYKPRHRS